MASLWRRTMVFLGLTDDPEEDEDYEDDRDVAPVRERVTTPTGGGEADASVGARSMRTLPRTGGRAGAGAFGADEPDAAPARTPAGAGAGAVVRHLAPPPPSAGTRVHVVEPSGFGDAKEIGDRMRDGQPVIVNMQAIDTDLSRRLIDFCSGATYALGGNMDKVATRVFLLTPSDVEVSAEEKRRLSERGLFQPAT